MASLGRGLVGLLILVGGGSLFAVISPENADSLLPGAGTKAKALRDALPFFSPATPPAPAPAPMTPQLPPASVIVGRAERRTMPVRIDTIGTVQPVASVVLRSRVDSQIDEILVSDGAVVHAGDILVKLDARQIIAQIQQAEAALAKDQAQLEQGQRDVERYSALVAKQAGTQINLDNAMTQVATLNAAVMGDQAALENLKVQLSYFTITAPITGRVGTISMKAGNLARAGEAGTALATINQISPIYVTLSVRQNLLAELRTALNQNIGDVTATPQGSKISASGKIKVIDNTIDAATGTINVKALFENKDEVLWPGQLCSVRINLRDDPNVVTVPRSAVQSGQIGNFVYVVQDNKAHIVPVTADTTIDNFTIIRSGLNGGEAVVTDGAMLLTNDAAVDIRAGSVQ